VIPTVTSLLTLAGRRAALNALLPTACWAAALALTFAIAVGIGDVVDAWERQESVVRVSIVAIVGATVCAITLVVMSETFWLVRVFEGRARMPTTIRNHALAWHGRRWAAHDGDPPDPRYPLDAEDVLPTSLGNVIAAAEHHPFDRYGLDGVTVWPRLYPLVPEAAMSPLTSARTGMEQMVVLATLSLAYGVGAGIGLVALDWAGAATVGIWVPATAVLGGWAASAVCYRSAVAHATAFAVALRSAFDLYRFDVLDALHLSVPTDGPDEHRLWGYVQQVLAGGRRTDSEPDRPYVTPAADRSDG
jgi:hypothetical protein